MRSFQQSTAYTLTVFMTSSTDHITGKTSLSSFIVRLSKAGGAFSTITPTITELESGEYSIQLTASHLDTLGDVAILVSATGADTEPIHGQVLPQLATISNNLDATVSSRSAPGTAQTITSNADITAIKSKTDNLPASPAAVSDIPSAATTASAVRTEIATELARVDAAISSRLASGAYTAPDNTGIGQINTRLPSDPADQSLIIAATDQIRSDIAGIPAAPSTSDIITAMNTNIPAVNIKKVNDISVKGSGTALDPWNPV